MNAKQKTILCLGVGAFVLMGLFPPWVYCYNEWPFSPYTSPGAPREIRYAVGYSFLTKPPMGRSIPRNTDMFLTRSNMFVALDIERLCVQWAIVAVITGGLFVICAGRKKDSAVKPNGTP